MSVRRAQREIDSREFAEWMAYANVEPFGPDREDDRAGVIAATIGNVYRDVDKRPEPFDPSDFFPKYDQREGGTTARVEVDVQSKLVAWAATMQQEQAQGQARSQLRPRKRKG